MAQKLGQVAEGKLVKINEDGKPVEFYVAKHDYESGLNGPGRTLLVRKDCYDKRQWHSSNVNAYSSSSIDAWLNNDYKNMLYYSIRMVIGTTKFYYTPGNGNTVVGTLERAVFLLSATELNKSESWINVEGAALPNAENYTKAKLNGYAVAQWSRSPRTYDTGGVVYLGTDGSVNNNVCTSTYGPRPAFTLPSNLYVWGDGTVSTESGPTPSTIHTPTISMQGKPINITWSAVDVADSYVLQRKADGGEWEQVYAGADTSYTDTAGSWTTVQYQVCGVFGGVNGAFAVSPTIQVLPASALSIGGTDGDLGALTSDVPYSVATNTGKNVTMDLAVNGVNVFHRADATTYTGTLSVLDLPTGMGSIVIAASVQADSGMVTAERKWTYTKPAQPFPASGGVAALTKDGKPLFPQTLAECVRTIGGPWGGDLGKALEKLARAATFSRDRQAKYTEVKVDLGKVKAGDIVNLPVKGIMTPHIVVQVGNPDPAMYDASCDGVWLLRQDIVENGQWNSTNVNTLEGSTIMTTMQGYVTDYDSTVQAAIQTVKIPYCVGNGSATVNTLADGLSCKMFPLSAQEIGCGDYPNLLNDGVKLDYFLFGYVDSAAQKLLIAKYNGRNGDWSLRTPYNFNENVWKINAPGGFTLDAPNEQNGYRPCFTLPATFATTYYVDESGVVHPSQEYTNDGDFYDLWGNIIPTTKIATGSYKGTGVSGSGNKNTIVSPGRPVAVMICSTNNNQQVISGGFTWVNGATSGPSFVHATSSSTKSACVTLEWNENSVSWYGAGPNEQLNNANFTYYYVILYK